MTLLSACIKTRWITLFPLSLNECGHGFCPNHPEHTWFLYNTEHTTFKEWHRERGVHQPLACYTEWKEPFICCFISLIASIQPAAHELRLSLFIWTFFLAGVWIWLIIKINIFAENTWQAVLYSQSLVYPRLNGIIVSWIICLFYKILISLRKVDLSYSFLFPTVPSIVD